MDGNYSLSDIAAVSGGNRDGMWGGDGAWWIIILFLFAFCGWGGNWGNGGGGANGYTDAAIQRGFDNQAVISKLNGLENGLCDGFYAMNTGMLNGFSTLNNTVQQGNFGIQQAINADTVAGMQQANALSAQLAQCCCDNREGQANIRYQMATDTCAVTNAINTQTQQIMQNCNANYRALHDELVQSQLEAKNEKIAEQAQQIQALNLAASQAAQNNYIVGQLRPAPIPAYTVANPYTYGCGTYTGCNC